MSQQTTVTIGEQDFDFSIGVDDYNRYINEQMPNDKVAPAFNFLMRTVAEKQKDAFKKVVLVDGKPNGFLVMQVAQELVVDYTGGVKVSLKKPKG
ncbi:putative phage tail assembly chaperone [Methylophaga sp. OBS4]|uniref:putative phage tail assembly chaperone n=1 Tax=Methylophaga sp. OBS4 TaxID=2991935 RepID=UPI00224CD215|nr:putative phage tail assembly chaperone [Methylophaga sp. OBS4]MCX4187166.1 putative phage tail assembly chaperone [Methylophaga sp. OBS4]